MAWVVVSLKFLLSIFLSHRQILSGFFQTLNEGQNLTLSSAPFLNLLYCLSLCYVFNNKGRGVCLFCFVFILGFVGLLFVGFC